MIDNIQLLSMSTRGNFRRRMILNRFNLAIRLWLPVLLKKGLIVLEKDGISAEGMTWWVCLDGSNILTTTFITE